jgi:hypothetical protein
MTPHRPSDVGRIVLDGVLCILNSSGWGAGTAAGRPTQVASMPKGRWSGRAVKLAVAAGALATGLMTGPAAALGTRPAIPTVSYLTSTPSSLSSLGGVLTLSASVTNAVSCAFTSNRPVVGLPATLPCSNGTVDAVVTVPANTGRTALTYKFRLAVTGTRTVKARIAVTVPSGYHIVRGSKWTYRQFQGAGFDPYCTVETFVSGTHWVDDFGDSGSYSGGGPSFTQYFAHSPGLVAGWSVGRQSGRLRRIGPIPV